jgi:acid phosphatase
VILDADETVLDNSPYQVRITQRGERFNTETYNVWVREARAATLPGSAEFIQLARQLGGRVVIVTNRDEIVCPATRQNFSALGIVVDVVLCKPDGPSDKNPRFQAVARGTAAPGLPPLRVLMYVGDNIQDFPTMTQELRNAPAAALEPFGRTYFVLPNPMYGSWERNPAQ